MARGDWGFEPWRPDLRVQAFHSLAVHRMQQGWMELWQHLCSPLPLAAALLGFSRAHASLMAISLTYGQWDRNRNDEYLQILWPYKEWVFALLETFTFSLAAIQNDGEFKAGLYCASWCRGWQKDPNSSGCCLWTAVWERGEVLSWLACYILRYLGPSSLHCALSNTDLICL